MDLKLNNKKVLITGASRGIGLSIAKEFLQEKAKVCIVSRGSESLFESEQELQKNYGMENVFASQCDCTDVGLLNNLRKEIENKWGCLDIVVANVGDGCSVSDSLPSNDDWQRTWNSNFEPTLQTARTFLPMLEKSSGVLLFISSISLLSPPISFQLSLGFSIITNFSTSRLPGRLVLSTIFNDF